MMSQVNSGRPAAVVVDSQGRLLDSESKPVKLVIPMPEGERTELTNSIREIMKPFILKTTEKTILQSTDALKLKIRKLEKDAV